MRCCHLRNIDCITIASKCVQVDNLSSVVLCNCVHRRLYTSTNVVADDANNLYVRIALLNKTHQLDIRLTIGLIIKRLNLGSCLSFIRRCDIRRDYA